MAVGVGWATGALEGSGAGVVGLYAGVASEEVSGCFFSRVGGKSVVECLPIVHGGIERNSSNVKTRGLQHFQPGEYTRLDCESKSSYMSFPDVEILPFCPS